MRPRMTPRRRALYDFIVRYKAENDGNSPSIKEMMRAVGLATTSAVHMHLAVLATLGLIERPYGAARGIRVIGAHWVPPSPAAVPLVDSQQRENSEFSPFPAPDGAAPTFFPAGPGGRDERTNAAQ